MKCDKRFHRLFPKDLASAVRYYDRISTDLGNRFRERTSRRLECICERPESFGFVMKPLRAALIEGFPYILLFQLVDGMVLVAGLYHASSNPDRWLERMEDAL